MYMYILFIVTCSGINFTLAQGRHQIHVHVYVRKQTDY